MKTLVHLLNVPNEGADAVFFVHLVEVLDVLKDEGHHFLLYNGEDRAVHLWPSVAAQTRFAAVGASTIGEGELGVARDSELLENVLDALGQGLVV